MQTDLHNETKDRRQWEGAAKAISENENILIALPFYIENIPGILLEFLSDITPKSRAARGKLDAKPYEYK